MHSSGPLLLLGASGLVGFHLYVYLKQYYRLIGTYCNNKTHPDLIHFDYYSPQALHAIIAEYTPSHIMIIGALTHVDYCELHPDENKKFNILGISHVLDSAYSRGIEISFFSTDYVFDGINGPYSEDANTHPINIYGQAKESIERRIKKQFKNFYIFRVANVFGWEHNKKNFIYQVLNKLQAHQTCKLATDMISTPTHAYFIAQAVKSILEKRIYGVYHIAGPECISRYAFGKKIADLFGYSADTLSPCRTPELSLAAPRPLNAGLKIDKIRQYQDIHIPSLEESLLLFKKHYETQNIS